MIYLNKKNNAIFQHKKMFNTLKKGQFLSIVLKDENSQLTNYQGKIVKINKKSSTKTISILQKIRKTHVLITFSILSPLIENLKILKEQK